MGVCAGVDVAAHAQLPENSRERCGAPFLMCMRYILAKVAEKSPLFIGEAGDIDYVFEEQPIWEKEARILYGSLGKEFGTKYRMGKISFGSKKDNLPLQAADRLVYETYNHFAKREIDSPVWRQFVGHPLIFGQYCDENGVRELGESILNID